MTPDEFIDKWAKSQLKERSAAQEHFIDLCNLLGEPTPGTDSTGEDYCFERGAAKAGGGDGWADVWKRGCFAWEYKGPKANLDEAFKQLSQYALALDNPPLHIACDTSRFVIKTAWSALTSKTYEIEPPDLADFGVRQLLKNCFSDPDALKPGKSRQQLTEEAAASFAVLAERLAKRGHDPHLVAHFVNRLVFCMFAEDVGMLKDRMFERLLDGALASPHLFEPMTRGLFQAMRSGGHFGVDNVAWFNGGLFDDDRTLPLEKQDIREIKKVAALNWGDIDPSILGTLFERGIDPEKRSQLGLHYTDRDKIMQIVDPVVVQPLSAEWDAARAVIAEEMEKSKSAKSPAARGRARKAAEKAYSDFLERLAGFRVLDPACGSGNFLYLSLQALKTLERKANLEAEALGLPRGFPRVGPEAVKGIEVNPYAAELARVSVWIGEIQWMLKNGFGHRTEPILTPLDNIECRDALISIADDGAPAAAPWPDADVIVGNPPFLGGKLLRTVLGDEYVDTLFGLYRGRVPPEADLVCYWFAKADERLRAGEVFRAGLVSTNSIRGGANRKVLDRALEQSAIFDAWSDEPWYLDGAAVRVSLVCLSGPEDDSDRPLHLDGKHVLAIYSDLTGRSNGGGVDLTRTLRIAENGDTAFMGDTKGGAFDIPGDLARDWLALPKNPNGKPNSDVLRPWLNGLDVTRRPRGMWIIDFGWEMSPSEAALYEAPFGYLEKEVKPTRTANRRPLYARHWWRHVEPRPGMWARLAPLKRYIATPTVAKHRLFVWLDRTTCPDHQLIAIARDDDTAFGVLHSRFHELWSLRLGTWLGVGNDPRYTPTTTFETFPFPEGLTPNIPAKDYAKDPRAQAIAAAAKELHEKRAAWLDPPDLVDRVPEVVPGFPERIVPKDAAAAETLKSRTLTNLYNERPAWLAELHARLDAAVAAAYGWPADLPDDEALARLFALNQERAKAGR